MLSDLSFFQKLVKVLIPTRVQAIGSLVLSLVIIIFIHIKDIFTLSGIDSAALDVALDQYHQYTSGYLNSQVASSAALITFWAIIGMVAYLICWSAYNMMIEARNEVTLKTQYTNQGRRTGSYVAMGLKVVFAALLLISLALLRAGFGSWVSMSDPAFINMDLNTIAAALGAVLGLAFQLYLVLAMAIAAFTPWYRK